MTGIGDGELETAAEMEAALSNGDVTSVELVERAVSRADAWQPTTRAFSQLWGARALEAASSADRRRGTRAPTAGIPIAVKDLFDVAGFETTGCCSAYRGNVASRTATVVERLLAAGLVLLGKTNQHELAAGGTNLVSACGRTGNPWDPDRMTGGSSGGSAAAVAARVVPWSLGSDTGGSVRIPSSLCGTFGLKPTTGALPTDGMMPLAPSMDCPGPLASTAEDLRRAYRALSGEPSPGAGSEVPPGRPRVAIARGHYAKQVHDEVLVAVEGVARALAEDGVEVRASVGDAPRDAEVLRGLRRAWTRICYAEFARAHEAIRDRRHLVHPTVVEWMEAGERLDPSERQDAVRRGEAVRRWFRETLQEVDAVLVPTTPYPAPRADEAAVPLGPGRRVDVHEVGPGWLTSSINLTGLPALSVPAARTEIGLPVGVSLVGREGEEELLLSLASRWERAVGYRPESPPPPR